MIDYFLLETGFRINQEDSLGKLLLETSTASGGGAGSVPKVNPVQKVKPLSPGRPV